MHRVAGIVTTTLSLLLAVTACSPPVREGPPPARQEAEPSSPERAYPGDGEAVPMEGGIPVGRRATPDLGRESVPTGVAEGSVPDESAVVAQKGTVIRVDLEGGFWGIRGDDGRKYLPMNLPEVYKKDGQRIRFEGRVRRDVVTTQQWGTVIDIVKAEAP